MADLVDSHYLGSAENIDLDIRNRKKLKANQMHIEIIGSTSAGKTTLAKKMVQAGLENGTAVSMSDDFMLDQMHLNWVGNEFIRRRLVEAIAFAIALTRMSKYREFMDFVILEGRNSPGSWFYKINRIRNVIRKIGIFEFIARRSGSQHVVLADNEGILQGVHNLFVHQNSHADLGKIAQYVELIPLPDVILYLQQEEDILISRTLARGHGRVKNTQDEVAHFIKQAVGVFNEMVKLPILQRRLLILNGELNVEYNGGDSENAVFYQVINLAKSGRTTSLATP